MPVAKDQIRQIISENNLSSITDVYALLRDKFQRHPAGTHGGRAGLNDLHNRGVKDVLFFCVDGLPGFKEAIQAVFPKAEIPELGSGAEPAGCPVRRTAYRSFIKRMGWQQPKTCHPSLIPSAFILLPEYPVLIPKAGCGQSPQKGNKITCLFVIQKNQKRCIDFI